MTNDDATDPARSLSGHRVGIIGTGHVGMAAASALFQSQHVSAIHLVDLNERQAEGEAMDLMHGQALVGPCDVTSGSYGGLADADVVVVTAGVGQKPGEDRLSLLQRNAEVARSIVAELDISCPNAILIMATNPVDVLTHVVQAATSRPTQRVFGTGTTLDSARLRAMLGRRYGVSPQSVHASVLGEHGDSEFVAWSLASIGGAPLVGRSVLGIDWDADVAARIEGDVRRAAYEIIDRKGHTNWAIGAVIDEIVGIVLRDERSVIPVSVRPPAELGLPDVCLSLPAVVGSGGVEQVLDLDLDDDERVRLQQSAAALHQSLSSLDQV